MQWKSREGSGETCMVMGICSLGELFNCMDIDAWKKHYSTPLTCGVLAKLKYG